MKCLKPYDVFISHAAEDKKDIADALCGKLKQMGFRVWYSGAELKVGDSISKSIAKGLKQSRYGILILSKESLKADWPNHELMSLFARHDASNRIILPVLHGITREDIRQRYPWMADIVSISTDEGVEIVAQKLKAQIFARNGICMIFSFLVWVGYTYKEKIYSGIVGGLVILGCIGGYLYYLSFYPCDALIDQSIRARISFIDHQAKQGPGKCSSITIPDLLTMRKEFDQQPSDHHLHSFGFSNIVHEFHSKVALQQLGVPLDAAYIDAAYGLTDYDVCLYQYQQQDGGYYLGYTFLNTDTTRYKVIDKRHVDDHTCVVVVAYTGFIRSVQVECNYDAESSTRHEKVFYTGLIPTEELVFEKKEHGWSDHPGVR